MLDDSVRCSDCKLKQRTVLITGGLRGGQFSSILGKEKTPSLFEFSSESLHFTSRCPQPEAERSKVVEAEAEPTVVANPRPEPAC